MNTTHKPATLPTGQELFGPKATILRADFNRAIAERDALREQNRKLREALHRLAALDDGDRQYWWHGEPEDAVKHARALLAEIEGTP